MALAGSYVLAAVNPASAQTGGKIAPQPDTSQAYAFADAVKTLAAAQSASPQPTAASAQAQTASANSMMRASVKTGKEVEAKTFAVLLSGDSDLSQAVHLLLAQQISLTRPKADAGRFATMRTLISTLCASNPPLMQQDLQNLYEHGDQAADRTQLRENEQLGRIIHMAFVRSGTAAFYDYRRTETYKRIVRRRYFLTTHPDQERNP